MEEFFAALADRTRLRILNLLAQGEICVCYFTMILDAPQPTVSRHLAYLRRAGLVEARRDGKWVHYSIAPLRDAAKKRLLSAVLKELESDPALGRDLAALRRACCATRLPPEVADAPRPTLRS
jgi:ArsR family transcriptional regulator, arsenate/arsenite/antimonite-responsive transcriptional repressor